MLIFFKNNDKIRKAYKRGFRGAARAVKLLRWSTE